MAFELDIDLDIIPKKKKEDIFDLDLDIDLDIDEGRGQIESIINKEVDDFFQGDVNLKSLLKETAAQESHFGKLDPTNIMQLTKPHLEEMKNEKYTPMLSSMGVFKDDKGNFDTSDPRTNILLGTMRYTTTSYEDKEAIKTQAGRSRLWKDVYNTEAGAGTPEKYLETLKGFGLKEEVFDPEGSDYDYQSARSAGLSPDKTGHWPSREPTTGLLLKGRKHKTWTLTEKGEEEAGYKIIKKGDRYYSEPKEKEQTFAEKVFKGLKRTIMPIPPGVDPATAKTIWDKAHEPTRKVYETIKEGIEGVPEPIRERMLPKLFAPWEKVLDTMRSISEQQEGILAHPGVSGEEIRAVEQTFQEEFLATAASWPASPEFIGIMTAQIVPKPFGLRPPTVPTELSTAYKTLGLKPDATAAQAEKAYTGLALKYHPDRLTGTVAKASGETKFKALSEAMVIIRKANAPLYTQAVRFMKGLGKGAPRLPSKVYGGGPSTEEILALAKRFNLTQPQVEAISKGIYTGLPAQVVSAIEKLTPTKEPWQMTQEEFAEIPIIKYIEANKKGMKVSERNKLGEQLVDMGLMKIEDFNAMTGQFGFGGLVTGVKDITTGKPIPSKVIEGQPGDLLNYIGQWQTFTNVPLFSHRDSIVRALVEGKKVPQKIIDSYKEWKWPDKEGSMATLEEAIKSYGGKIAKPLEPGPTITAPVGEDLFAGTEGVETGLSPEEVNKIALEAEVERTGMTAQEQKEIQEITGDYKKSLFAAIKENVGIKPIQEEDKALPLHLKSTKGFALDKMVGLLRNKGFYFEDVNDLRQTILDLTAPVPKTAVDILTKIAKPKKIKAAVDWSEVFKGTGIDPGKVTFKESARALERIGKVTEAAAFRAENMATQAQETLARMIAQRTGLSENQLRRLIKIFTGRTSLATPRTPEEAQKWAKKGIVPMSREEASDLIDALKGFTRGEKKVVIPRKYALQVGVKAQLGTVARVRIGVKTSDMGFKDIDTYLEIKNIGKKRKITTENMTEDEGRGFIKELTELKALSKGERIEALFGPRATLKNKKFADIHKEIKDNMARSRGAGFDRGGRRIEKGQEWHTPLFQSLEIKGLMAFKDVRLTLGQLEVQSGVPLYAQGYQPLSKASRLHSEEFATIKAELIRDLKSPLTLKEQGNIERYFDHKFRAVTLPKVSALETTAINNIERTLLKYRDFVRQYRYHQWLESKYKGVNQGQGLTDIKDVTQETLEEGAQIYETQGPEALEEWLKAQNFGTIDIGYVPRAFLRGRVRIPYYKIGSFSHKMLKTRDTQVDFSNIPLMARINKYFKNILNLKHMEQPVKKFDELLSAVGKENVPLQTSDLLSSWVDALKGQRTMSEPLDTVVRNVFTRQFYRVITLNPFLWWRNLWQRGITPPHKAPIRSIVINLQTFKGVDLRAPFSSVEIAKLKGKLLSPKELAYFEREVGQFEDLMKRYLQFLGEHRTQMPIADKYIEWAENIGKTYAVTDDSNRLSVDVKSLRYYQHYNNLLQKGKISEQGFLNNTPFKLMRQYEQTHFLELMDKDPEEAVLWAAKWNSDNSQWLYKVPERSLSEMKTTMRSFYNLLVWTRGYMQNIGAAAYKATRGRNWGERIAGIGAVISTILGGYLVEEVNKAVFRRKSFGYNPIQAMLWAPGGPVLGQLANTVNAISYAAYVYSNNEDEFKKKKAIDRIAGLMDRTPEMFVPFYNNVLNIFEAITDTAYVSPLRQIVTGKAPKEMNRSIYERILHAIFGGVNEGETYLNELEGISQFEIDIDMDIDLDMDIGMDLE